MGDREEIYFLFWLGMRTNIHRIEAPTQRLPLYVWLGTGPPFLPLDLLFSDSSRFPAGRNYNLSLL